MLDEQDPLAELTAIDVLRAIALIPSVRATGPCGRSGADFRSALAQATRGLVGLLRHAERAGVLPS